MVQTIVVLGSANNSIVVRNAFVTCKVSNLSCIDFSEIGNKVVCIEIHDERQHLYTPLLIEYVSETYI